MRRKEGGAISKPRATLGRKGWRNRDQEVLIVFRGNKAAYRDFSRAIKETMFKKGANVL